MGKYIRKAKLTGEVAVMEVSAQSSIGVRTRARTLALRRHQKPSSSSSSSSSSAVDNSSSSSSCYLQLRSRRLEKPAINLNPKESSESKICDEASPDTDGGVETSFGENVLDFDCRDRNARETTPCSLIRTSETIRTPGSTTRLTPTASAFNRSIRNAVHQNIPNSHEIEEFFAGTERLQQRKFMEKYNFDLLNDFPLPGRYEWVKLDA